MHSIYLWSAIYTYNKNRVMYLEVSRYSGYNTSIWSGNNPCWSMEKNCKALAYLTSQRLEVLQGLLNQERAIVSQHKALPL